MIENIVRNREKQGEKWWSGESTGFTNVGSNPGDDAMCGLSFFLDLSFAAKFFLRVVRFSPLHKNQHFQIPIRPVMADEELLYGCATS